jgi:hypothetical protein
MDACKASMSLHRLDKLIIIQEVLENLHIALSNQNALFRRCSFDTDRVLNNSQKNNSLSQTTPRSSPATKECHSHIAGLLHGLYPLSLKMEIIRSSETSVNFNVLHCVTSQKIKFLRMY